MQCWVQNNFLFVQALGNDRFPVPGAIPEKLDLMLWKVFRLISFGLTDNNTIRQVEREDKCKFTLIHPGGVASKFKTETQKEADNWIECCKQARVKPLFARLLQAS